VNDIDSHMRSPDRVLELEAVDKDKKVPSNAETSVKAGNKIHVVMDEIDCLWRFKYDAGVLPAELKQRFTTFKQAYRHAEEYFSRRNLKITEVRD
jgi:hypothetical protein